MLRTLPESLLFCVTIQGGNRALVDFLIRSNPPSQEQPPSEPKAKPPDVNRFNSDSAEMHPRKVRSPQSSCTTRANPIRLAPRPRESSADGSCVAEVSRH